MVVKKRGESTVGQTGRKLTEGKEYGDEVSALSSLSLKRENPTALA